MKSHQNVRKKLLLIAICVMGITPGLLADETADGKEGRISQTALPEN